VGARGAQEPDGRQLRRLLRARRARSKQRGHADRAADKSDELPAPHAIDS